MIYWNYLEGLFKWQVIQLIKANIQIPSYTFKVAHTCDVREFT